MSNLSDNAFNNILNYFIEDEENEGEDSQEKELVNYEQNSINDYYKESYKKNSNSNLNEENSNINNNRNDSKNEIFTKLHSNIYNDNNDNDENIKFLDEKKLYKNEEELEKNKFSSFQSNELKKIIESNTIYSNKNEYKKSNKEDIRKNEAKNWSINNKEKENPQNLTKKDFAYNKIILSQCSFGNINEVSNHSTSINTDKLGEFHQSTFSKDKFEQKMFRPEYLINSKSFDELENHIKTDINIEDIKNTNINSFKQNENDSKDKKGLLKNNVKQLKRYILQKSKDNCKKKLEKIVINKNNNNFSNYIKTEFNDKKPIELILYDDALHKRDKIANFHKNNLIQIQLTSTRRKINKKSYHLALQNEEKKIENLVKKYSNKNVGLSILDIAKIYQDLNIFRQLLQNININKLSNINTIEEFKNVISIGIKGDNKRKIEELEFLEKTWNILNPEQKNKIRKDIFEGFLKIIFFSSGNIIDIDKILRQYLQAALFGEGIASLNYNNNRNNSFCLKDYIKQFFILRDNMVAYQNINHFTEKKYEKILKEKNQNLIFEPNIPIKEDFRKTVNQRKKNFNFESLYNRFIQKEKYKKSNLERLKQNQLKEELKELKQRPTITKYKNNNFSNDNYRAKIYEKLYKMDKCLRQKREDKIKEKNKEDLEIYEKELKSFKLNINSKENRKRMAKSFDNKVKPKGYDIYINRNKKAILERKRIKNLLEKIPCGENYEKIKKRSISPFNITDMKKKRRRKNQENEDYFTLQIKIPNGQLRKIKIDSKSEPYQVAEEFCKIYSIKDIIKQKLIKNIIECKRAFLNNRKNQEINEEEKIEDEKEKIENNETLKNINYKNKINN